MTLHVVRHTSAVHTVPSGQPLSQLSLTGTQALLPIARRQREPLPQSASVVQPLRHDPSKQPKFGAHCASDVQLPCSLPLSMPST